MNQDDNMVGILAPLVDGNIKEKKDFPTLRGDTPVEVIVNFYDDVGWDGESKINRQMVGVSQKGKSDILEKMREALDPEDRGQEDEIYRHKGPVIYENSELDVPDDEVYLFEGWLVSD